jgi:dihydropyrimidinase
LALLIKNGLIVTAERSFKSDILIEKDVISEIGEHIEIDDDIKIIDASGKYIFPGGIDPHVHLKLKTAGGYSSDDFYTGTKAAIYGGVTTIIDFVTPEKDQSLVEAFKLRKAEAHNSLIDYSFHVSPIDYTENTEKEIKNLIQEGITSFKVYLAYKDSVGIEDNELFEIMRIIADKNALLTVHAEEGDIIDRNRKELKSLNKTTTEFHAISRPNHTEADSVKKVIEMAAKTGCSVYFVHISAHESLEHIDNAQKNGLKIFAETCPQYLMFDDLMLIGDFEETSPFVFSPPLRKEKDRGELWKAMSNDIIQTTGTDHCPFFYEQKIQGIDDFTKIPNGTGGIEHRLSVLFTYGVLQKKISLNRFVALSSTNAAKIFGMYPQKGEIAVGSDADILIWNPEGKQVISTKTHHQNSDQNIYEGIVTVGSPETVIINGKVVLENIFLSLKDLKPKFLKRYL